MIYPQSKAEYLSKNVEAIGKYGCLAMCYLNAIGVEGSEWDYIGYVSEAMDEGFLDKECTVLDGAKFLNHFAGVKRFTVTKKAVTNIKDIKARTPVRYDYNGHSHWVVVENGQIEFNSLLNSLCVTRGKPTTARIIELRK